MKQNGVYVILGAVVVVIVAILIAGNVGITSTEMYTLSPQAILNPPRNPGPPTISLDKPIYRPGDTVKVTVTATANKYGTGQISTFKMTLIPNVFYKSIMTSSTQTANAIKLAGSTYKALFSFKIPKIPTFNSKNPFDITIKAYDIDSQGRSSPADIKVITQVSTTSLKVT